jgi:two-component system sensor histidine kinase RpfC
VTLARHLSHLFRPGPASESRQALWRLGCAGLLAPALALAAAFVPASAELDRAAAVGIAGLLYATAWLGLLGGRGAASAGRRWAALLCDGLVVGALLASGGAQCAPLYLLLVALALDHGLRFGPRALPRAAAVATAAMLAVLAASPFWQSIWPLALALAVLPLAFPLALRPLRRTLLQAQREARRAYEARHRVLQELDHEFRAPLDAIVGVAKTHFATRVSPEQREGGELVLGAAQSLLRRVADTLDLAAAEAGALAPQPVDFNLRDGVARTRNALQPLASAKGVVLQVDVDERLPARLRGDARRLWQMLARLLQDGIDRTEEGSVVAALRACEPDAALRGEFLSARDRGESVESELRGRASASARWMDRGSAPIRTGPEGLWLRLSVRDTGVDSDEARRRRSEALRAGTQPDLVTALAALLGGRSGIEPNPGGGLHAWIELPLGISPALPEADYEGEAKVVAFDDPLVRHRARVRSLRLLLADEPCANRLVLQRLLQRAGHEVLLADDGEQALERIERGEVDAGIAHVRLAGMGGLDVLRYARMLQSGARPLPLALLSADASPALVREAEAAGAFAFLPRPVQVPRLLEVLSGMSEAIRAPLVAPAAPMPDGNAPAIGLEVVQELIALNLGEGFVASFVEQCLRDAGQCMAEMERCGGVADWEGMREAAHALKGLGQNFAARAVADACDALVRSGDLLLRNDWRRRVAQLDGLLQACWRQVRVEMDRLALGAQSPVDLDPGTEKR